MGISDPIIFPKYLEVLQTCKSSFDSIAFLGFSSENDLTRSLKSKERRDFYDIQLGNWDINSDWILPRKYDLIVCTRCAYFAKSGEDFILRCLDSLSSEGFLLVDWGLGDHWRFPNFKVGWVRDGEHEHSSYAKKLCYLYSCLWDERFENDENVINFSHLIKQKGYGDEHLSEIVRREVPNIIDLSCVQSHLVKLQFLCLWEKNPQLYIIALLRK